MKISSVLYFASLVISHIIYAIVESFEKLNLSGLNFGIAARLTKAFGEVLVFRKDYDPIEKRTASKAILALPSFGCAHYFDRGGCGMCGYNKEIEKYGFRKLHPQALILLTKIFLLFFEWQLKQKKQLIDIVHIFMAGSFLNDRELPRQAQNLVIDFFARSGAKRLVIESRPEYIIDGGDRLAEFRRKIGDKNLEVVIGLEAVDDKIRNGLINKNISLADYRQAVSIIKRLALISSTYLLVGAPRLKEHEIVESAVESAKYAWQAGTDLVNLEIYCVQAGTRWADLYRNGSLKLPTLWDIITVVEKIDAINKNWYLGQFNDWPTPIAMPANCPVCTGRVLNVLNDIRSSHNISLLEGLPSCDCRRSILRKGRVKIRRAEVGDIDALVELEKKVWGEEMAAGADMWLSRIRIFPLGVLVADKNGEIVGVVAINIISWDLAGGNYPSWEEASANGYITNYNEKGGVMYGVDLTVLPKTPTAASRLLQEAIKETKRRNIKNGYLGCRVVSLKKYVEENNINCIDSGLVKQVAAQDTEVRFFISQGFKIAVARENYFPPDQESLGWGVILELV